MLLVIALDVPADSGPDGGPMTTRVAALCCLSLMHGSVVAAEELVKDRPAAIVAAIGPDASGGPFRSASLSKAIETMLRADAPSAVGRSRSVGHGRGTWMERHPVWAGALVGFSLGVALTYVVTYDSNDDELFTVMSPAAGALIWGSVSAGVGALAGWGIGRNLDDDGGSEPVTSSP
jgi:hypothetical protein